MLKGISHISRGNRARAFFYDNQLPLAITATIPQVVYLVSVFLSTDYSPNYEPVSHVPQPVAQESITNIDDSLVGKAVVTCSVNCREVLSDDYLGPKTSGGDDFAHLVISVVNAIQAVEK